MVVANSLMFLGVLLLGAVALFLIAVVIWLAMRFQSENARMRRETIKLQSELGHTMEKVLDATELTNDRAYKLLTRVEEVRQVRRDEVRSLVREETEQIVGEAVKRICGSVEGVLAGLMTGIGERLSPGPEGHVSEETDALPAAPRSLQPARMPVTRRRLRGWPVLRWEPIGTSQQAAAMWVEATRENLNLLDEEGAPGLIIDVGDLEELDEIVVAALAHLCEHPLLETGLRVIAGSRGRRSRLQSAWEEIGSPAPLLVYESREAASPPLGRRAA